MKCVEIRPMIWSRELKETMAFYVDRLGFTCDEFREDWGWASLHRDDIGIMIALPNEHTPFQGPAFTGSFYITTDDVDGLWQELKDKARVCYPIENFFYGMREFAVYDNNGYLLQFGSAVKAPG